MADVLLLHHAQGQTPGFLAFADALRAAGHTVHAPDLYAGRASPRSTRAWPTRGRSASAPCSSRASLRPRGCPSDRCTPASPSASWRRSASPRPGPGAGGAVLLDSAIPFGEFAARLAGRRPVQIHGGEADEFFMDEGDVDAARAVVAAAEDGELFTYPGCGHLFADASATAYDPEAAALVQQRVLDFLARV